METLEQYKTRVSTAGGRARAAKLSPDRRKQIARIAASSRWANHTKQANNEFPETEGLTPKPGSLSE